jgi:hypothetical protein
VIAAGCQIGQPVLLQYFIFYLRVGSPFDMGRAGTLFLPIGLITVSFIDILAGYLYSMGFCLMAILRSFAATRSQLMALRTGIRVCDAACF